MTLHIDLQAIVANWTVLAAKAPGARAGAVVKADAYGLGAARVAPRCTRQGRGISSWPLRLKAASCVHICPATRASMSCPAIWRVRT